MWLIELVGGEGGLGKTKKKKTKLAFLTTIKQQGFARARAQVKSFHITNQHTVPRSKWSVGFWGEEKISITQEVLCFQDFKVYSFVSKVSWKSSIIPLTWLTQASHHFINCAAQLIVKSYSCSWRWFHQVSLYTNPEFFSFSQCTSTQNSTNPAIWLPPRAGRIIIFSHRHSEL